MRPILRAVSLIVLLAIPLAGARSAPGRAADAGSALTWPGLQEPARPAAPASRQAVWVFLNGHGGQRGVERVTPDPHARWRREVRGRRDRLEDPDRRVSASYLKSIRETGVRVRTQSRWFNAVSVSATPAQLQKLRALPFVRELRPVATGRRRPDPRMVGRPDAAARLQYGTSFNQLEMLGVPAAHDAGLSGVGIRVLMLDTGFYTDHQAFGTGRVLEEWDFINQDGETQNQPGDPEAQHRHGTATATALGGHWPGELYGPAYACQFLLAKTEDTASETPVEEDYYVAALEWGEARGADVASASLGYTDWYQWEDLDGRTAITTQAVDLAVGLGLCVVVSAGNNRDDEWGHIGTPADAFGVISTGAVDAAGQLAWFSSPGPTYDGRLKPEVSAQGVGVAAAGWDSPTNLRYFAGTSLSCPLVAGCAALLLEAHPFWTPAQVRAALMSTADRANLPDNDFGWGVVNLPAALERFPEPGPVSIALSGGQVRLSWPRRGYDHFRIYQADQPWGPFTLLGESADTLWTGSAQLPSGSGFYRIQGLVDPGR
ncbi:MAG: S8 family serine peptidase [Candidatus Delongbacteria bacterium]